jgi:hypothetical protein
MKYYFIFCLDVVDTKKKKMNDANTKILKGTQRTWK